MYFIGKNEVIGVDVTSYKQHLFHLQRGWTGGGLMLTLMLTSEIKPKIMTQQHKRLTKPHRERERASKPNQH